MIPGSSPRMSLTVAPGKQRVVALKKRTFLKMLSPTSSVVGLKRGRGEGGWRRASECGGLASAAGGAGGSGGPAVLELGGLVLRRVRPRKPTGASEHSLLQDPAPHRGR